MRLHSVVTILLVLLPLGQHHDVQPLYHVVDTHVLDGQIFMRDSRLRLAAAPHVRWVTLFVT